MLPKEIFLRSTSKSSKVTYAHVFRDLARKGMYHWMVRALNMFLDPDAGRVHLQPAEHV